MPLCPFAYQDFNMLSQPHVSPCHPISSHSTVLAPVQMPQSLWACFLNSSPLILCITPTSPRLLLAFTLLKAHSSSPEQMSALLEDFCNLSSRINILIYSFSGFPQILCTLFVHYTIILGSTLVSVSSIRP